MLCILQDEGTWRSTQVQRTWFARERVEETSAHCGCKFIWFRWIFITWLFTLCYTECEYVLNYWTEFHRLLSFFKLYENQNVIDFLPLYCNCYLHTYFYSRGIRWCAWIFGPIWKKSSWSHYDDDSWGMAEWQKYGSWAKSILWILLSSHGAMGWACSCLMYIHRISLELSSLFFMHNMYEW